MSRTRDKLAKQRKANQMMLDALPEATTSVINTALQAVLSALEAALKELEHVMATLVAEVAPALLTLRGIGVVLAGTVIAEVGDIKRFENAHHFASYGGAAPVERGSGKNTRWCVNVSGNRQLNRVLHLMALTRLRCNSAPKHLWRGRSRRGTPNGRLTGRSRRTWLGSCSERCRPAMVAAISQPPLRIFF